MGCESSVQVSPNECPFLDMIKLTKSVELNYEQKYLVRETWKFLEVSKREIGISVYKR